MEAGCVPVIIADQLVLPQGPDWESCCVRIPEKEIASIPMVLGAMEAKFELMSEAARSAWEQHFSLPVTFDHLVEWGSHLIRNLTPRRRERLEAQAVIGEVHPPKKRPATLPGVCPEGSKLVLEARTDGIEDLTASTSIRVGTGPAPVDQDRCPSGASAFVL